MESSKAHLGTLKAALGAVQETGSKGRGTGSPEEDPKSTGETVEHCRKLSLAFTSSGQPNTCPTNPRPGYFSPPGREGTVRLLREPTSQIWIPPPKFEHVQGLLPRKRCLYLPWAEKALTHLCALQSGGFVRMNTCHCSKAYCIPELESQPKNSRDDFFFFLHKIPAFNIIPHQFLIDLVWCRLMWFFRGGLVCFFSPLLIIHR